MQQAQQVVAGKYDAVREGAVRPFSQGMDDRLRLCSPAR
jgi:hypothetical protein